MAELPVPPGQDETYWLLNQGLALYAAGHFFEAHELWEQAWNGEVGLSKRTLQALIQLAAALHKHRSGEPRGTAKLLAKAVETLTEVQSSARAWLSIDLVELGSALAEASGAADAIAQGQSVPLPPPSLPAAVGPDSILYLHGFASGPSSAKAQVMVAGLRAQGYRVEVPDLNEDDFSGLTVGRALARARRGLTARTLIVGSSMGGYLAALLAASDERVKGMVLMAPAFDFAERMAARHGPAAMEAWRKAGTQPVEHYAWGGLHPIGYALYEEATRHPARPRWRAPTIVFQGRRDEVVDPAMVEAVLKDQAHVELHLVDDDHGLVRTAAAALAAAQGLAERLGLQPWPEPADPAPILAALDTD